MVWTNLPCYRFWQNDLAAAEKAGDRARAQDATRFIEEYAKLLTDMLNVSTPPQAN